MSLNLNAISGKIRSLESQMRRAIASLSTGLDNVSSAAVSEAEIDVGATPVAEATVNVVNASITTASKIIGGIAYSAPTGKDLDEVDMDAISLLFKPLAGSFDIKVKGLEGSIADKFKVWYTYL
jgi:hypothetical protein